MPTLDDILGQDSAIEWLRRACTTQRLPHALLFAGPIGVGKATTAAALAKLFLCESPRDDAPCGKCQSCTLFDAGNHPDYHVVTKELIRYHDKTGKSKGIELSINVVRAELIEPASRKATMGRGKVFVVEQAELMNINAQHAILKTLEEPAGRTLIVLLTDQSAALPATVRSRCQLVRFAPLDQEMVKRELKRRGVDGGTASTAAELSGGSLGLALKWVEDGVIEPARQVAGWIDDLLAGKSPRGLPDLLKSSADAYAAKQLERDELASKDQATREGLQLYLTLMAERLRRRLAEASDADQQDRTCAAIDAVAKAQEYLDANVNVALLLQQVAGKLDAVNAVVI